MEFLPSHRLRDGLKTKLIRHTLTSLNRLTPLPLRAMLTSLDDIRFRVATSADVPAMATCRLTDAAAGPADTRMAAYFAGKHHPQQALAPRVGYVALVRDTVIGYIAGHLTTRHGCAGEVQYLFVAPEFRRRRVATALLRLLADWFGTSRALKVCVCVDADSPAAEPFYVAQGASPFRRLWYGWDDISVLRS
jgi:GNAT superfamily N-acetyltransferase